MTRLNSIGVPFIRGSEVICFDEGGKFELENPFNGRDHTWVISPASLVAVSSGNGTETEVQPATANSSGEFDKDDCDGKSKRLRPNIFPNPAKQQLFVQMPKQQEKSIQQDVTEYTLLNINGVAVVSLVSKNTEVRIPISHLLGGIYSLKIVTKSNSSLHKIFIQ